MNKMKKFMAVLMSMVMALSTMVITCADETAGEEVATEVSQWKENAITAPEEGKLVGAGYIDVEFDNSMEGYTYTVYLDGEPMYWIGDDIVKTEIGEEVTSEATIKTFTSADSGVTEVYTTTVSKHELTVVASDGVNEYTTDTRTFYVSKKGLALGGDMSDQVSLQKLNCSWYYNWAAEAFNTSVDEGVSHVPMMWGDGDDSKESILNLSTTSNYILGFNEPDIASQADMGFWEAVDVWEEYITPLNMRKVSPAPAAPGGDSAWLKRFMEGDYICTSPITGNWGLYYDYENDEDKTWVDGISDDVDSVSLHYYKSTIDLDGLISAVETLWETYHKPIWITEISVFGMKGFGNDYSYELPEKREAMAEYVQGIVEYLDDVPYVERYCWFAYDIDSTNDIDGFDGSGATAMFEYATGLYTELGALYSSIGNPEGYESYAISDGEMYVYVEEETTTVEETTAADEKTTTTANQSGVAKETATTQVSASDEIESTISKPGKVTVTKAENVKKKSVKLKWKKVTGATKYQVQYSLNKKFTKKLKSKTTTKSTLKIGKLKKRKYFFRVRAINSEGNGKWSKIKKVKIEK